MKNLFLYTLFLGFGFQIITSYFASAQMGAMPHLHGHTPGAPSPPSISIEEWQQSLMKYCLRFAKNYPAGKLGDAWHLCTHTENKERSFFEDHSAFRLTHYNCVFTVRHRPTGDMGSIHAKIKWYKSYQDAQAGHKASDIVPVSKLEYSQVKDYFFNIERIGMKVLGTKPLCTS